MVIITYVMNSGQPVYASATIGYNDLGTGNTITVPNVQVAGYVANAHPYHHERGHLIGKQLGGDGTDARNFVALSDGTNAPIMSDIEGFVREILTNAGPGSSVFVEVTVDYSANHYAGSPATPFLANSPLVIHGTMVGSVEYHVYDVQGGAILFTRRYPNGVVKNHAALGCC
ncbi:MAG: DNA/RNA non-specific endonuclease [Ktedonobacteraceae bacterium]